MSFISVSQCVQEAIQGLQDYDLATTMLGKGKAIQDVFLSLNLAKSNMKPVAWRVSFYPGAWKLYEYDPTGLPGIREIRPLYE